MRPKSKRGEETNEKLEAERRSEVLRKKAYRTVLGSKPPASTQCIPKALEHCDNADITKRNTSRKKKYLFLFPGALELEAGARIGQLDDLNTTNPTLSVEVDGGKIVMSGTLVLPKNALFTLKAGRRRREVKVVDSLDTIIAFSEWKFVRNGFDESEASAVPSTLIQSAESDLWKSEQTKTPVQKDDGDEEDSDDLSDLRPSPKPVRSNPRRNARAKGYVNADMESEELEDSDQDEEEVKDVSKVVEHINLVDDEDDEMKHTEISLQQKRATNRRKTWTQTCFNNMGRGTSNRGRSRGGRGRLKRLAAKDKDDDADDADADDDDDDEVEIVENMNIGPGRSSGRKRKKVTYTQSDDELADNDDDDDDFGLSSSSEDDDDV